MAYENSTESERLSAAGPEAMHGTAGVEIEEELLTAETAATAERLRSSAANGLDSAADAVYSGGERMANAAHRAGDALASGAEYVRDHDVRDMIDDFAEVVRNNPGPALLCAAALGFVLGRSVYRH